MAFSFASQPQQTPAFGAARPGGFASFGFGASSTPAFGQASAPAFGASPNSFGAPQSASAFGVSQSAPAFGSAQPGSLFGAPQSQAAPAFGAASTPSLFGGASTPSLFGGSSTPSLFGGAATGGFGQPQQQQGLQQQQQQQQQQPQYAALATTDNKPLSHYTKWDEISPAGQNYLLQLEGLTEEYKAQCRQLDECERLKDPKHAKKGMEEDARQLSQTLQGVSNHVQGDMEEAANLSVRVKGQLADAVSGYRAFQRSLKWRQAAAKASQGQVMSQSDRDQLSGPITLPSQFLQHAVPSFQETVSEYRELVVELENNLPLEDGAKAGGGSDPLYSLQQVINDLHGSFVHVAAQIDTLNENVADAKEAFLAQRRQAGEYSDPFAEAERRNQAKRDAARARTATIPPARPGQAQPQHAQQAQQPSGTPLLALPAPAAAPAASAAAPATGTGLFGSSFTATPASAPATSPFSAAAAAPAGGLFGAPAAAPAASRTGLFGAATTPAATPGLFGAAAPAGGGLFGAATPAAAPGTGLFGAPAAGTPGASLFGAPAATTNAISRQASMRKGKSKK